MAAIAGLGVRWMNRIERILWIPGPVFLFSARLSGRYSRRDVGPRLKLEAAGAG